MATARSSHVGRAIPIERQGNRWFVFGPIDRVVGRAVEDDLGRGCRDGAVDR